MPCKICHSSFNLFNWKLKCGECSDNYCKKCLKNQDGVMFCEKCTVLIKRPPDRNKLMELKPKDLQEYLQKHNIPTIGLVEKSELVDLLCDKPIPVKQRKGAEKLMANFPGSVPNLTSTTLSDFIDQQQRNGGDANKKRPQPNVRTQFRPPYSQQQSSHQFTWEDAAFPTQSTQSQPQAPPRQRTSTSQFSTQSPSPSDNDFSNRSQDQPTTSATNVTGEDTAKAAKDSPNSSPSLPKYPKLSDYESADELNSLSAKELKTILTLNRVDYKGCVEKRELLERAKRLWKDSNKYKNDQLPEEVEELCKLCMDAPLDCVLLECGHIATCISCGKKLAECPICRQYVARVVRTFKA